jgi:hypothetical protein
VAAVPRIHLRNGAAVAISPTFTFSIYMKAPLFLAAAFALVTSAALAQTVAPGTSPGAQTGNPSNMPSAGSTTTTTTTDQTTSSNSSSMSGSDRSSKRAMRKSGKMKSSDGSMKTKTKM